jgi:hypothetical protein
MKNDETKQRGKKKGMEKKGQKHRKFKLQERLSPQN